MGKRTLVVGLGGLIFVAGIFVIAASTWSGRGPYEYKQPLATYPTRPATGKDIPPFILVGPFEGEKGGINVSGSFQGDEGQAIFHVRDYEGRLVYPGPPFPPPSNIIEFDIDPGYYTITFNILFSNDSRVEVYEYRKAIGIIYPHRNLYNIGVFLCVAGIIGSAVGLFMPSKGGEENIERITTMTSHSLQIKSSERKAKKDV